jgi:hypothetical protein
VSKRLSPLIRRVLALDKNFAAIVLFLCVTYSVKLLVDARMRYLFVRGESPQSVQTLLQGEERLRRASSLRWGLILVFVALGFALVEWAGWREIRPGTLAVMAAAAGLGNLAAFVAARRFGSGD